MLKLNTLISLIRFVTALGLIFINNNVYALKVGVTAGPHALIMEEVKREAAKSNLNIEIIEFSDFIIPNAALDSKEIDLNSYQHQPFLDDQVKSRGYKIVSIAKTILLPMGIYSVKHDSIDTTKDKLKISIPNDPTNEGRALLLLKKAGFIDLKTKDNPTILDIIHNRKNIDIIELEAPQLTKTLKDVDYAVVNTDWIMLEKIDPNTALFKEDINSPYTNIIAVREEGKNREDIKQFIAIYQSSGIKQFIENTFKSSIITAW